MSAERGNKLAEEDQAPTSDPQHQSAVERQGARVNLQMTVQAEAVVTQVRTVAQALRRRARLRGFRRGKAPMSMIRQQFSEEIKEHVLDRLIPEHLSAELSSRDMKPIHAPVLDEVDFDPEGPLTFAVHFDVAPEVEVAGYSDLRATRQRQTVTEEAINQALGHLRERAAKLEPLAPGQVVSTNDFVRAEIALYPRDGKGKRLAEEDRYVQLGSEAAIPGLNSQLEGLEAGSTREFVTRLGESYPNHMLASKEVTCRVKVKEVKRRHLPDIDDELAKDLGLADLEALRTRTREDLARHLEHQAERDVERQLLDQVLKANPIDAPASLLEDRLDQQVRRAAHDLARRGIDPRHSIDWSSFRAENKAAAERAVKEELLLDRIAEAEKIEVEDTEVVAEIDHNQDEGQASTATIVRQMRKEGSFESLRRLLARQRALDYMKHHATIDSVEDSLP
ncbi:MAG: trigger factor [Acidobacteriota bacterium]